MINRFLIPEYIAFSLKLKLKEIYARMRSGGKSPYEKFSCLVEEQNKKFPANIVYEYKALNHFSYDKALEYYGGSDFITNQLILALIYWNESEREDSLFIDKVQKILVRADEREDLLIFRLNHKVKDLKFHPDRVSGLVQSKALSLFVRAYWLTNDLRYEKLAFKCYNTLLRKITQNGPLRVVNRGIWIEEYPSLDRPSMVLNGHLFVIIGIADFLSLPNEDESIFDLYCKLLNTTLSYLSFFYQNDTLLYSMYDWKPCNVHYLGIMQSLCNHLFELCEASEFDDLSKWLSLHCPNKLFDRLINH